MVYFVGGLVCGVDDSKIVYRDILEMAKRQEKMAGFEKLWDSTDGNEPSSSNNDFVHGCKSINCLTWI